MQFEWDEKKAAANQRKHGVSFHEAATIFGDPMALTFNDPDHSVGEQRWLTFGRSSVSRMLIVAHYDEVRVVRIISARKMTRRERKIYEQG